jgi:hypothetical protein
MAIEHPAAKEWDVDTAEREIAEVYVSGDLGLKPKSHVLRIANPPIGEKEVLLVDAIQGAMRLWRKTLQSRALKRARTHRDAYFSDLDMAITPGLKPEFTRDGSHQAGCDLVARSVREKPCICSECNFRLRAIPEEPCTVTKGCPGVMKLREDGEG